jgi:hypothetical protein
MSKTNFIGFDNGISGSIGILTSRGGSEFFETPVIKCLSYTKEAQHIHRLDWLRLKISLEYLQPEQTMVMIERPMVNPKAFKATQSAMRCLEATLIVLEMLLFEYVFIDSKEWQRQLLSSAVIGHEDMKEASLHVGTQLYPIHTHDILKHKDADGLLIAHYCKLKYSK